MFDQLGGINVGDNHRGIERRIQLFHRRDWTLGANTDDDAIRPHQVFNRKTLAKKFRVADHVEIHGGLAIALNGFRHLVPGFDRHGRFINHDFVTGHCPGNLAGDFFDEA